ncbi:G2E3 ligase, partial [Polypterus senegalus]|nr:G2E3 ligase [Polypterus senegalus]
VSVEDILENLAMQIKSEKVSRFNINRADIWDGALHGFKRSSFDPIKSLSSVECLRSTVEVHATMLMIAGCLCHVIRELSDKDKIVEDYLKWYFFTRNAACIQRMKQNPSGFMKYFCFSEKKITAEIIENLFKAEFSQPGSNRRQEELRIAAYWADYLLDIEGKTSFAEPSLEDILMFSTGVSSIPPIGFHPKPTVNFLHNESPYPIAQTCTNSLSIPIHKTYDKFKYHMNFGILNSPGFGQH